MSYAYSINPVGYVSPPPSAPPVDDRVSYPELYQGILDDAPAPVASPYYGQQPQVDQPAFVAQYFQSPAAQQQPRLTQAMHGKTQELLAKADEQAGLILGRKTSNPPPVNPYYGPAQGVQSAPSAQPTIVPIILGGEDRSWKMFNNETIVHNHYHPEGSEKESDDSGTRVLAGVVGLVIAFAAAFFIGKAVANGEDVQEEQSTFDELKGRWQVHKDSYYSNYQTIVDRIVTKTEAIMQRHEKSRTQNIAMLISAFVAGGALFAGALAASKVVMAVGLVVAAATTAFALYKAGYSYFSTRDQKDAQAIDRDLIELSGQPLPIIYP